MRCCINCFNDRVLRQAIEDRNEIGKCDFCESQDILTIETEELNDLFESVLKYYEKVDYQCHYLDPETDVAKIGAHLGFLLQDHWNLFSDKLDGSDKCNELIAEICNVDACDIWCSVEDRWNVEPDEERSAWDVFSKYLKKKRHFFFDFTEIEIEELINRLPLLFIIIEVVLPKGSIMFRSRLGGVRDEYETEMHPFAIKDMGAPPPNPNDQGRGNPPGISYLYAASDEETAVAEQRPARKSLISLAELETSKDLKLIDLAHVPDLESPFGVEYLEYAIHSRRLLRVLGSELSRPVSTKDSPIEYLPSQFLCELILNSGYDGVIYASGYGGGENYLLFDTNSAKPIKVELVEIQDSKISFASGELYNMGDERLE